MSWPLGCACDAIFICWMEDESTFTWASAGRMSNLSSVFLLFAGYLFSFLCGFASLNDG